MAMITNFFTTLSLIFVVQSPTYISDRGTDVYVDPPACSQNKLAIRLQVTNIKKAKGSIVVDLHNDIIEEFLHDDKVVLRVRQKAEKGQQTICIPVPSPGNYALAIYHDKDDDRKFDKNFLGIPSERFGLSQNPKYRRKAPKLIDCIFSVGQTGKNLSIRLVSSSDVT